MAITNGNQVGFVNAGTKAKLDQYKSENALDAGTFYIADEAMYLGTSTNTFTKLGDVLVVTSLPPVSASYIGKLLVNVTTGKLHVTEAGGTWQEVSSAPDVPDSPLVVCESISAMDELPAPSTDNLYYVVSENKVYYYDGAEFKPLITFPEPTPPVTWTVLS
jgi:hypothetical protein